MVIDVLCDRERKKKMWVNFQYCYVTSGHQRPVLGKADECSGMIGFSFVMEVGVHASVNNLFSILILFFVMYAGTDTLCSGLQTGRPGSLGEPFCSL